MLPAYDTHHYTKDKVVLSNLTLIQAHAGLDGFQTSPQPLDSSDHYSPCASLCLTMQKTQPDPLLQDVTVFEQGDVWSGVYQCLTN